MTSSFPMLGTLFVPDFLFGRPFGLIRTETPIDAFVQVGGLEPPFQKVIPQAFLLRLYPVCPHLLIIPYFLQFVKKFFIF